MSKQNKKLLPFIENLLNEYKNTIQLSKYEYTALIATRVDMLNTPKGCNKLYIEPDPNSTNVQVAEKELINNKLPYVIRRDMSNNTDERKNINKSDYIDLRKQKLVYFHKTTVKPDTIYNKSI